MELFYLLMALFLYLNILAGLTRVFRGPTKADRMLAGQLFRTLGTAICLLLAESLQMEGIRDTALVFVILSIVFVVSFVRRIETESNHDNQ